MMRVLTVVGARPQFIKAAPVCAALAAAGHRELLVHTGQHYDDRMSAVFFSELGLRAPDVNLGVGSGEHGAQTAAMLAGLEPVIARDGPDVVVVYGDTNSTLAGALAACKLGVPLAHVEAGLRSYNRAMPEEHNRILADHCADLLLCPTATAVRNLEREGLGARARQVGDTMLDALLHFQEQVDTRSPLAELGLAGRSYALATFHRPYNVDVPERLRAIIAGLAALGQRVVLPVHPRTRARMAALDAGSPPAHAGLHLLDPIGYLDMVALARQARVILTDSGGLQKEAYFLGVPCVTVRPETEWPETVASGWNVLVDADAAAIVAAVQAFSVTPPAAARDAFGDGHAAERVVSALDALIARRAPAPTPVEAV